MNPDDRFQFDSLEDAARVCGRLAHQIETQKSMLFGMHALVLALMSSHHDHVQIQLATTTYLEGMLGQVPEDALSPGQAAKARSFVENLQASLKPFQQQTGTAR